VQTDGTRLAKLSDSILPSFTNDYKATDWVDEDVMVTKSKTPKNYGSLLQESFWTMGT